MVIIFTLIVITVMNKTHELIYLLPDRVLQWIGINGMALGEDAVAQRVEGGAGQIKSGANAGINAGVSAVSKAREKEAPGGIPTPSSTSSSQSEGGGGTPASDGRG